MESNTPAQPEGAKTERPRPPGRLTGERLGNKVQLAQALLNAGQTITKTAKDLGISRHSVQAIAGRMRTPAVAAPSGEQPVTSGVQKDFETYVKGDLQRVAKLSLQSITPEKAQQASLRDLSFAADKTLGRLEAIEARTSNLQVFAQTFSQYGITPSHSVSRMTLEQKITVETEHTPFTPPTET